MVSRNEALIRIDTAFSSVPRPDNDELHPPVFDETQRAAIVAFFDAMTDSSYGDDALRALQEWR